MSRKEIKITEMRSFFEKRDGGLLHEIYATEPEWVGGDKRGHRISRMGGRCRRFRTSGTIKYFGGYEIEVDYSIWRLIMHLNTRGFKTKFCCSGLPEDHRDKNRYDPGYIAFAGGFVALVSILPEGLYVDGTCIRVKRGISIEKHRGAWKTLLARILERPSLCNQPPNN